MAATLALPSAARPRSRAAILSARERQQHRCPADVQVGVVLPRVADAAVHLHVLQRDPLIGGQHLPRSHRRGQFGLRTVGARSIPGDGNRQFGVDAACSRNGA